MFEIGVISIVVLAVGYWVTLWLMGRHDDVLDGDFVHAEQGPNLASGVSRSALSCSSAVSCKAARRQTFGAPARSRRDASRSESPGAVAGRSSLFRHVASAAGVHQARLEGRLAALADREKAASVRKAEQAALLIALRLRIAVAIGGLGLLLIVSLPVIGAPARTRRGIALVGRTAIGRIDIAIVGLLLHRLLLGSATAGENCGCGVNTIG